MAEQGSLAKNWTFTWHAPCVPEAWQGLPIDARFIKMFDAITHWEDVGFFFAGKETCPHTGGRHLQGYIHFEKKKRLSALKKLNEQIHWEVARDDWECNYNYCTKEDKEPFVFGDLPEFKNNGEREKNRWEDAWEKAKAGDFEDIPKDIALKFYNGIKSVHRDYQKKPQSLTEYNAEWIWGRSGSGKSTLARMENPDSYPKEANKWWCGYQGEDVALVEDLDPDCCKHLARYVKVWLDTFPFCAEVKGTSNLIRPKKIVITSQYTIEECFNERDAEAVRRRCRVRKIENFAEVPDTSAPNADPAPGTAPTVNLVTPRLTRSVTIVPPTPFVVPETPVEAGRQPDMDDVESCATQVDDAQQMEDEYRKKMREIRKGEVIDLTE